MVYLKFEMTLGHTLDYLFDAINLLYDI